MSSSKSKLFDLTWTCRTGSNWQCFLWLLRHIQCGHCPGSTCSSPEFCDIVWSWGEPYLSYALSRDNNSRAANIFRVRCAWPFQAPLSAVPCVPLIQIIIPIVERIYFGLSSLGCALFTLPLTSAAPLATTTVLYVSFFTWLCSAWLRIFGAIATSWFISVWCIFGPKLSAVQLAAIASEAFRWTIPAIGAFSACNFDVMDSAAFPVLKIFVVRSSIASPNVSGQTSSWERR